MKKEDLITSGSGEAVIQQATFELDTIPKLPNFNTIIRTLRNLFVEIRDIEPEDPVLINFYYPLIASVYRLGRLALDRLHELPSMGEREKELEQWYRSCILATGELIEFISMHMSGENDLLERFYVDYIREYTSSSSQWNSVELVWVTRWIAQILEKKNQGGEPPFYIYIKKNEAEKFPKKMPRIYEGNNWLSGFGGRLLVLPNVSHLSSSQKAELWNILLTEENIYGDQTIDHSIRENVFNGILNLFPKGEVQHVDLCGGNGDFILWLKEHKPDVSSILIDNADQAVGVARQKGIDARVGDAEEPLPLDKPVDVISIIFAMQWISPKAYVHAFNALKPGGYLIANIYPPDLNQIEVLLRDTLEKVGFVDIRLEVVESKNGEKQSIVRAQRPTQ